MTFGAASEYTFAPCIWTVPPPIRRICRHLSVPLLRIERAVESRCRNGVRNYREILQAQLERTKLLRWQSFSEHLRRKIGIWNRLSGLDGRGGSADSTCITRL